MKTRQIDWAKPDIVLQQSGHVRMCSGLDVLRERIMIRLMTKKGQYRFNTNLGSELYLLLEPMSSAERKARAKVYIVEALAPEMGKDYFLELEDFSLNEIPGGALKIILYCKASGKQFTQDLTIGE